MAATSASKGRNMKEQRKLARALVGAAGLEVTATAHAQFAVVTTQPGSFTDISGTGALVVTGDDQTAPVTVSAAASNSAFPAGSIGVCTNGHVGYGNTTTFTNGTIP